MYVILNSHLGRFMQMGGIELDGNCKFSEEEKSF